MMMRLLEGVRSDLNSYSMQVGRIGMADRRDDFLRVRPSKQKIAEEQR